MEYISVGPSCMSEMTAVMSCWKVNSFDDVSCTGEIKRFIACVEKAVSVLSYIYLLLLNKIHFYSPDFCHNFVK